MKSSSLNLKILFSAIFLLVFFGWAEKSFAANYYISPAGSDSYTGTDIHPWATFSFAFTRMQGGDTLYIKDGIYHQQIAGMPSGSADNPTRIMAVNEHQVTIDGEGTLDPLKIIGKSYVEIAGIRAKNANAVNSVGGNDVIRIENSSHIIIRRSGFWQAGTYKHNLPIYISSSSDCLLEDVWAFGRGRYTVMDFGGQHNTLRRVVVRWDSGSYTGEPNAGIAIYNTQNATVENCIVIDSNEQSVQPNHSGIAVYAHLAAPINNTFAGNIIINNKRSSESSQAISGMTFDPGSEAGMYADDTQIKNSVIWANDAGLTLMGVGVQAGHPVTVENLTIGKSILGDGIFHKFSYSGTTIKNSIIWGNTDKGIENNGPASNLMASYLDIGFNSGGNYANASCVVGCVDGNPEDDGIPASLMYLPRIESSSALSSAGEAGQSIGANIVNRYVDGVLTEDTLWSWPYEDFIQEDMREISSRGFCAEGQTLTKYIWEYLGNSCPGEICGETFDATAPAAPSGLAVN